MYVQSSNESQGLNKRKSDTNYIKGHDLLSKTDHQFVK